MGGTDNLYAGMAGFAQGASGVLDKVIDYRLKKKLSEDDLLMQEQVKTRMTNSDLLGQEESKKRMIQFEQPYKLEQTQARVPRGYYLTADNVLVPIPEGGKLQGIDKPERVVQSEEEKLAARNKAKLDSLKPKAQKAMNSALYAIEDQIAKVDALLNDPKLSSGTGWQSSVGLSKIPGSKSKQIEAKIKSIKAQGSLDALQEMRMSSPTGGALGNVSDAEGARLENKRATLDPTLGDEDLKNALNDYRNSLVKSSRLLNENYYIDFGDQYIPPKADYMKSGPVVGVNDPMKKPIVGENPDPLGVLQK